MGIRVSGGSFTLFGFGINWERTPGDERVAREVVLYLEDRRLLFGERHYEDERHCIASALECREFLTTQLVATRAGSPLEATLKSMRAAFRHFVERAGPDGRDFRARSFPHEIDRFSLALGDLRAQAGEHLARIAWRYEIEVDEELAMILPPEDEEGPERVARGSA